MTENDALTIEPVGFKIARDWTDKFIQWHEQLKNHAGQCDPILREIYTPETGEWNIAGQYLKPEFKEYVLRTASGISSMIESSK